jgi:hypothetical protein
MIHGAASGVGVFAVQPARWARSEGDRALLALTTLILFVVWSARGTGNLNILIGRFNSLFRFLGNSAK